MGRRTHFTDTGFTLVELMVVSGIIGILVSIAVPMYTDAHDRASAKSCQANQRTIVGSMQLSRSLGFDISAASDGVLESSGSGWYGILVPGWIKSTPSCPTDHTRYSVTANGDVVGDQGEDVSFKPGHEMGE